jgi:hypothetical protein
MFPVYTKLINPDQTPSGNIEIVEESPAKEVKNEIYSKQTIRI